MQKEIVLHKLNEIIESKDEQKAWEFFDLDFIEFTPEEETNLEIALFRGSWHELHENLALGFQDSRDPLATDALYEATLRDDIEKFEYKPISRKCTWALADIGTEKAKYYLKKIAQSDDAVVAEFARKRLDNWENEIWRKGQRIPSRSGLEWDIRVDYYSNYIRRAPVTGNHILAYQTDSNVVVYQAYKPSIAKFAVENQCLGGADFSYSRMSWIKPNFLWMMYRSGWAEKENQERILAIWISKQDFESILNQATLTSFDSKYFTNVDQWKKALENSEVRLQWDPDHDPYGNKLQRRAVQLGLKGATLENFAKHQIKKIIDVTNFVKKQSMYVRHKSIDRLLIPIENIYSPNDLNIKDKIGIN